MLPCKIREHTYNFECPFYTNRKSIYLIKVRKKQVVVKVSLNSKLLDVIQVHFYKDQVKSILCRNTLNFLSNNNNDDFFLSHNWDMFYSERNRIYIYKKKYLITRPHILY